MPGARIWDVAKALPKLVWPSAYYPFLHFHVATNVIARGNLEYFTSDYRTSGGEGEGHVDPGGILLNAASEEERLR